MSEAACKFYLTTPIYYVNARPHIGHAYTTIVADVLARRHRLAGDDTWFLTGTDEHGLKIERASAAAKVPPQSFTDEVSATFRRLWDRMGLTYDQYIRTTDEAHKRGVQRLWQELESRGKIYLSSYTGQYCVSEEIFVEGPPGTIGPDGRPTETVTEENYFFRLGEYQLPLLNLLESGELDVQPETRRNELLSFLRGDTGAADPATLLRTAAGTSYVPGALRDLSISRSSFTWGIPVPGNPKHVVYVWLDALANYMTAVGYGDDSAGGRAKYERYWPADLHIVGKEIIRQHCIYWPAFLLAAELPLPKKIVAHGWLLFEESKMSKSKGNIVRAETILEGFGEHVYAKQFPDSTKRERDLFAADVLRYFLLREIPFGQDGSFSFDALITRYNADLANGYGNLVSRTLAMIQQYFSGAAPDGMAEAQVLDEIRIAAEANAAAYKDLSFASALESAMLMVKLADGHLTRTQPWKLGKDPERARELRNSLTTALEAIQVITRELAAVLPFATAQVTNALGDGHTVAPLAPIFPRAEKGLAQIMSAMEAQKNPAPNANPNSQADALTPTTTEFAEAPVADQAGAPVPSKFVDESFAAPHVPASTFDPAAGPRTASIVEPNAGATVAGSNAITTERPNTPSHAEVAGSGIFAGQPADASPQIGIDDFAKVELRVAQVVVCERIPKADKLLRLEVDLGYERRQILSGIAEWYTPEELIGRRIVVITNLAPRKMRGLESHGMLLAASSEGGKPALATFVDADVLPLGSRLK